MDRLDVIADHPRVGIELLTLIFIRRHHAFTVGRDPERAGVAQRHRRDVAVRGHLSASDFAAARHTYEATRAADPCGIVVAWEDRLDVRHLGGRGDAFDGFPAAEKQPRLTRPYPDCAVHVARDSRHQAAS
ncbi:MAG: hypothetical protein ABGY41_03705 [Candidatus Poribacteria bacterium]